MPAGATLQTVDLDVVRGFHRQERASGVAGLAAGFAFAFLPQAAGRGFLQAVAGGRLAAVGAVLGDSAFQLADPLLEGQDALDHVLWFAPGLGQKLRSTPTQLAHKVSRKFLLSG